MKNKRLGRQTGFNLLEVLIAVLVLSVGLLGLAGLQIASLKATQNASSKQQVAFLLDNLLERIRNNPLAVQDYDAASPVEDCSSQPVQCNGAQTCTAQQLAFYDIYNMQCGDSAASSDVINSGLANLLPQGSIDVECLDNCDGADTDSPILIRMEVSWVERLILELARGEPGAGEGEGHTNDQGIQPESLSLQAIIDNPSARSGT